MVDVCRFTTLHACIILGKREDSAKRLRREKMQIISWRRKQEAVRQYTFATRIGLAHRKLLAHTHGRLTAARSPSCPPLLVAIRCRVWNCGGVTGSVPSHPCADKGPPRSLPGVLDVAGCSRRGTAIVIQPRISSRPSGTVQCPFPDRGLAIFYFLFPAYHAASSSPDPCCYNLMWQNPPSRKLGNEIAGQP